MRATTSAVALPTVIICPGNGCTNIRRSNWYGDLYNKLQDLGIPCVCETFPDPNRARRSIWVPFIRSLVEKSNDSSSHDNVILVGHSSGSQAALRYAEQYSMKAAILVAATYSDLGDQGERESGYYPQPAANGEEVNKYDFDSMKKNCPVWHQFHSDTDPFIPLHEAEQIRDGLELTDSYRMLPGRSHFFDPFPELLEVIQSLC
jgi:predicted alpha/beta hydrolase family esterase